MEEKSDIKTVSYSLEPAFLFATELSRLIVKAGTDPINEWFFFDGAFTSTNSLEMGNINTWANENFVVIHDKKIIAYFEGHWDRPLDIIESLRIILFDKTKSQECWNALFDYFRYLFELRGCNAVNWSVALKNTHVYKIYEIMIARGYCHKIGIKHHCIKSYTGKISDAMMYEMTKDEYMIMKNKNERNSEGKHENRCS